MNIHALILKILQILGKQDGIIRPYFEFYKPCRLQFWLGGREHPLEDSIESPPTAGRKDFVLQRKIWVTASYKFAERKLA
ncbi:MAG: hypothetical protein ACFNX0_07350 [Treponema sp.]